MPGFRHLPRRQIIDMLKSDRVVIAAWIAAGTFAAFQLVRLILLTQLATTSILQTPGDIVAALAAGALRDLAVSLLFAAPFLLLVNLLNRLWRRPVWRAIVQGTFIATVFLVLFSAVAEFFFWEEFASRFNGIAFFYLLFPREVIGNLQESFNLGLYMPFFIGASLGIWALARRHLKIALSEPAHHQHHWGQVGTALAIVPLALILISIVPREVAANREVNELAHNGWISFVQAALTNDQEYDGVYPTMDEKEAIRLTRNLVAQDNTTFLQPADQRSLLRFVDNGKNPKKLNIVLITNESFGSKFVSSLDYPLSKRRLTPALDKLGKEGLFFTNIYASGDRTVRGLEATETAFAPIPGISTARRAESQGMYSLPSLLESFGYETAVLYGGHALFDNMGTFWQGIGYDHVWDQSDIRHESFTTIWGVSDEDLYTETLARMDEHAQAGKPFMITLMTVSNHRPYKFPEDNVQSDPAITNRENTAHYADWAFGDFIERARAHPWFDDTVFVFVADHSEKINGAAQVPLQDFRIPLLIYAPKHIAPRRIDTLGAQIDLIPTLMGLLKFSYVSPFFGIDLLRVPEGQGRIAAAHNFSVAFARPGHAITLEPTGEIKGYSFIPGLTPLTPEDPDPETARLGTALTQTAHHMFYANQYHLAPDKPWPSVPAPLPAIASHMPALPDRN